MEDDNMMEVSGTGHGVGGGAAGGGGGTGATSRWNPTKEQINMLETLYMQGIRTPSAEQIQQITGRLRAFGHIEGKNVFYWFQNHKARQRQKQKQESIAYFNRFLQKTAQSLYPPACPNVCRPYCLPQSHDLGLYTNQCPKLVLQGGFPVRSSPTSDHQRPETAPIPLLPGHGLTHPELHPLLPTHENYRGSPDMIFNSNDPQINNQETLALFPLQPTGILPAKSTSGLAWSASPETSITTPLSSSSETGNGGDGGDNHDHHGGFGGDRPYFDFFSARDSDQVHWETGRSSSSVLD